MTNSALDGPSPPLQTTLARPAEAEGIGLHSGRAVRFRLEPAPPDSGLVFVRTDLPGRPEIQARPDKIYRDRLTRMTVLAEKDGSGPGASIGMIEHFMAACAGLGLTNARAMLDGPECPIFDGSAGRYVQMIDDAGIVHQDRPINARRLQRPVVLIADGAEIVALPSDRMRLTFFAVFHHKGAPDEQATFEPGQDDFRTAIAPARTFCFWEDVEKLRTDGLIKGGSLENAIVIREGKPIRIEADRIIEGKYRLQNELARHKLLDLMGDLAVLGFPIRALISARGSGHALHHEFTLKLIEELD